jgi:toxin ParE1/3/4
MPNYRLTRKADSDLKAVYFYSFERFGKAQAEAYVAGLQICFQLLAEQPRIGQIRPGKEEELRLFFHRSHVVGYRIIGADILIQRVLDVRREWQRILRAE